MKTRAQFDLPRELEPVMERAKRLEWLTIGALMAIVIAIYLTMGSSQAMKAAWIEDLLSFVTPISSWCPRDTGTANRTTSSRTATTGR